MLTKPNMTAVLWFSQFIIIFSVPSLSCFLMAIFSCHFDGHPQFSTFVIPNSFTSTSKVDVSIKYAIVTHLNKQRPDNVVITSVYFSCCSEALTCESPPPPRVPVNLFDLWPLFYVSQTTNTCSCDGGLPVGSHPQTPVQIDWDMSAQRQQWVSKKKWLL